MIKRRAWIALFLLISLISTADIIQAQENYNVVDVVVEGNKVASKSLILGVSSLEIGTPLTATNTAETIRRLYGLGIFSYIRIEAEPVNGGLKVYLIVKELPKLSDLEFEGNKKIKTSELKDKLNLGVGGYISPYLIDRGGNEIKDLYAKKGYFQAEVVPALTYSNDSFTAVLKYRINEKSKVKVEKVVLIGNSRVHASQLIKKMRNRKRGFLKSSDFAQDKFDDDLKKVIDEYHHLGFIDAYMISDSTSINKETNRMTIYLYVYEGPEYYFGKATFKNNKEIPTSVLKKQLKFKEGQVFDADRYDESLQEIYSVYYDIGHLHINIVDNRTTRADSIIDISYDISEGLPSNIHFVKIVGNTKTKDKVIRRELKTFPGQKFNRAILIRSIRDAMALNYFTNVTPTPLNLPNGDVDIEYKVEEKQTGQISAGAGYNSQDKLVGNLGMGIPNFRGNGQSLNFNIDFGSRRNSFSLSFTEPWLFGRPTLLGIDLYTLNRRWFSDYTEGRNGGSIKLGRRLRWPDNFSRIFGSYRLERDRYYDFDAAFITNNSYKTSYWYNKPDNATTFDYLLGQVTHKPYPGSILAYNEAWLTSSQISLTISRDSRNLPEFATSGSQITYTFEKTGGILGGFWDYQKHMLTVAKFIPLFWKFAIAAKVQYGAITSSSGDDSKILLSDRFTPGGTAYDGIVRGYDDGILTPDSLITQSDTAYIYNDSTALVGVDPPDSIVVTNGSYTRVRGNYMLVSNIELQFPIVEHQIYTLLFFDAGNSWLHRKDIKPFTDLYKGVGAGFRIVVPGIGTIGFDFGYALDEVRGYKKGWKPHFQIGTTFR